MSGNDEMKAYEENRKILSSERHKRKDQDRPADA